MYMQKKLTRKLLTWNLRRTGVETLHCNLARATSFAELVSNYNRVAAGILWICFTDFKDRSRHFDSDLQIMDEEM